MVQRARIGPVSCWFDGFDVAPVLLPVVRSPGVSAPPFDAPPFDAFEPLLELLLLELLRSAPRPLSAPLLFAGAFPTDFSVHPAARNWARRNARAASGVSVVAYVRTRSRMFVGCAVGGSGTESRIRAASRSFVAASARDAVARSM